MPLLVPTGTSPVSLPGGEFTVVQSVGDLEQSTQSDVASNDLSTLIDEAISQFAIGNGLALLYVSVDDLRLVNGRRSREISDNLLAAVEGRMQFGMRKGTAIIPAGGAMFAVIQQGSGQPYPATRLAQRLLQMLADPFMFEGQELTVEVSIGIAIYPNDGSTSESLRSSSDIALYSAKVAGPNTIRLFDQSLQVLQRERQTLLQNLTAAIERQDFTMTYRPICDTASLRVHGVESQMAVNHMTGKLNVDANFFQTKEGRKLLLPLELPALKAACHEAATWANPVWVSVDLSAAQFQQAALSSHIKTVLNESGLNPSSLAIQVTDIQLLDDTEQMAKTMKDLKDQGVRIFLDDFGAGYANLNSLNQFPFDCIKIAGSLVHDICEDDNALAIVESLVLLGMRLNLQVVAEGVETGQQLRSLKRLGCPLVEGRFVGKVLSSQEVKSLFNVGQSGSRKLSG